MFKELRLQPTLDCVTRILALTPLLWICLGIYIAATFFISTGVWPDAENSMNPVKLPSHLQLPLAVFQIMFIFSFLYIPAIFVLLGVNFGVVLKKWRLFAFVWAPMFIVSCLLALFFAVLFGEVFISYM